MGTAKALVALGGAPLIARPIAAAEAAGLEVVVMAKPSSGLPALDVPVWHEPETPAHPLVGLVTALERAEGRPVIALACDLPFVAPGLLARLAACEAPVAVVRAAGRLEPFPGRYSPEALPVLRDALAREASLRSALGRLRPVELGDEELRELGDPVQMVAGINTPEELAAAGRRLGDAAPG